MADLGSSHDVNKIIEDQLRLRLEEIEGQFNADAIVYMGPIVTPSDDMIKDVVEGRKQKRPNLVVMLETPGGYIETAQRIADTLRHHYSLVDFIVPNYAMSAGTVLVMSGDNIFMDYYSVLGPIDPQVQRPEGRGLIPALGYLVQYERLMKKAETGQLNTAEMAFLLKKFDPAELYRYEQEKALSEALLNEWLVKYKFKNWLKTKTGGVSVTLEMKKKRAAEIAAKLNETEKWHSHGRGITMEILRNDGQDGLNLIIEDFGANEKMNEKIKNYYKLIKDYSDKRQHEVVIHDVTNGYSGFSQH